MKKSKDYLWILLLIMAILNSCLSIPENNIDPVTARDFSWDNEDPSKILKVDYEALISRSNLHISYRTAPQEGLPIGNGRVGSVLWMDESSLYLQVNRNDAIYHNAYTTRKSNERDSANGCGSVKIDFGGSAFPADDLPQTLHTYDALAEIYGNDISIKAIAWHREDVIAIEIEDKREQPEPIKITLSALRDDKFEDSGEGWSTRSYFTSTDDQLVLNQIFEESSGTGVSAGNHFNATSVAVGVEGRTYDIIEINNSSNQLVLPPSKGKSLVLIGSSASLVPDSTEAVISKSKKNVEAASLKSFEQLFDDNREWWHDFWSKSFIHLESRDGKARECEIIYNWYLYIMASCSRSEFPFQFDGMLFTTRGGHNNWGNFFWNMNTVVFYSPLLHAGHFDLYKPFINLYSKNLSNLEMAAGQFWGAEGIYIPETMAFNGLAEHPDALMKDHRDFMLCKKDYDELSEDYKKYRVRRHSQLSPWNSNGLESPFSYATHIFNCAGKVAFEFWRIYDFTLDKKYLAEQAYPILKGVAEFFRTHPLTYKEEDGLIHTHHGNCHEPVWDIRDSIHHLAAIRATLPAAIRSAEILGKDEILRAKWQQMLDQLTSLPVSTDSDAVLINSHPLGKTVWACGREPVGKILNRNNEMTWPLRYDFVSLEAFENNSLLKKIANASYEADTCRNMWLKKKNFILLWGAALDAAKLGRKSELYKLLYHCGPEGMGNGLQANRLQKFDTDGQSVETHACFAYPLQLGLLQSMPAEMAGDPVIRIGPAWTRHWEADFSLYTRRGFKITSSVRKGIPQFVEILSGNDEVCRIRNPWPGKNVELHRADSKPVLITDELMQISVAKGETIILMPEGLTLN